MDNRYNLDITGDSDKNLSLKNIVVNDKPIDINKPINTPEEIQVVVDQINGQLQTGLPNEVVSTEKSENVVNQLQNEVPNEIDPVVASPGSSFKPSANTPYPGSLISELKSKLPKKIEGGLKSRKNKKLQKGGYNSKSLSFRYVKPVKTVKRLVKRTIKKRANKK